LVYLAAGPTKRYPYYQRNLGYRQREVTHCITLLNSIDNDDEQ